MAKKIDFRAISGIIKKDVSTFTKVLAVECSNTVISRTPVDSSSLVASYHLSAGGVNPPFRALSSRKVDPGAARNKQMDVIDSEAAGIDGYSYKLQTDAPYALDVHFADHLNTGQLRFMNLSGPDVLNAKDIAIKATK